MPAGYPFKPDWEVTPREAAQRLADPGDEHPGLVLLDCRTPDEHHAARIRGAVLIPLNELERRAEELEHETLGRGRAVLVYCHHGVRSMRAASFLRALGFSNARSIAGGIDLWSIAVDPAVPRYAR
ncbi:MAG: rhodanese-like domain-containing protein [Phycisphaerae bacterium]|nr:rhodanese-like domain-containing protein [Phycisphaerae bacterium]